MAGRITRREFIETTTLTAAGLAAASAHGGAAAALPTRPFGKTGLEVTCLAFGCGSRFLMYPAEQATEAVLLEKALALRGGVNYFDTAIDYGCGRERAGAWAG